MSRDPKPPYNGQYEYGCWGIPSGHHHLHHYCCRHDHKCSCGYCFGCGQYVPTLRPSPWVQTLPGGHGWVGGGFPPARFGNTTSCSH